LNVCIYPQPLAGRVDRVISSKSQAHRLLICAALAESPTVLERVGLSADVAATVRCLRTMGARIEQDENELRVAPPAMWTGGELDCGESGSTLRFLLPVAASLGLDCLFTGQGKLAQRPLSPLYEELCAHGVRLSPQGAFPLRCAGALRPGRFTLAGNVSSQFISGLLMALPRLPGDSEIAVQGQLESRPYIDMTLDALKAFGVSATETGTGFRIPGGQRFRSPGRLATEGDWSGAAFWLAAGALSPEGVFCGGLNRRSFQGDRAIVSLLRRFGAVVEETADTVFVRYAPMEGVELDAADIPDLVPVLAVVAAAARGETRIRHIARLRLKESDRVMSVLALLHSLGMQAEEGEDTLYIHGTGKIRGGRVDAFRDHRIVLAAAVAASAAAEPVRILGAEAVNKSYPGFFEQFAALGGRVQEENNAV